VRERHEGEKHRTEVTEATEEELGRGFEVISNLHEALPSHAEAVTQDLELNTNDPAH
jgi:hypothetical protein